MPKSVVILKTGSTFPDLAREYGDFEHWVQDGLALPEGSTRVVDSRSVDGLPDPNSVTAAVITGSHDMVTEAPEGAESTSDWLRDLVAHRVPVLGICYGHQLLAHALGGEVGYNPQGLDVGTATIRCLPDGRDDPLLSALPPTFPAYVTHAQSVLKLPHGALRLAETEFEPNQVFRVGDLVWGVQFHPEFSEPVIRYYIAKQRLRLAEQGQDADQLIQAVLPSPAGRLLKQFGRLTQTTES
jgi:GMP synthase (glutamine-hydrolysing)